MLVMNGLSSKRKGQISLSYSMIESNVKLFRVP